jgi:hypothetical protein
MEWKRLMKCFDFTKEKYNTLFQAITIINNFLHKCHIDFTFKIINDQIEDPIDFKWDGDF